LSAGEEGICIGDHVHVATGVYLFGSGGKIILESFCGLSSRVSVYTATDDYSEGFLTNPTVPNKFRNVRRGDVVLRRHALVGASSVLLPGVTLGLAASIGALSLVYKSVGDFVVAFGSPLKIIGERDRSILLREEKLIQEEKGE
jgi:galactoside O-acetyltransferase